jgi:hypothetical protein
MTPCAVRVATRYLSAKEWGDPSGMISDYRGALTAFQTSLTRTTESATQTFSRFTPSTPREQEMVQKAVAKATRGALSHTFVPLIHAARQLSEWVLQTRMIPAGKAKPVEMAARSVQSMARAPQDIPDWYEKNAARLNLLLEAASWPEKSGEGEAASQVVTVGPFKVHNTIGADEKQFKEIQGLVENAARSLSTTRDFGNVLYGDVYVVGQLRQSHTLAWYKIQSDDVYVRSLAKKGGDDLHSLIHELGHRYWFKFATSDQKRNVNALFMDLGTAPPPTVTRPTVGDELPVSVKGAKGTKFIIVKDDGMYFTTEPKGTFPVREVMRLLTQRAKGTETFPSQYSMTDSSEFFAECFAFYTLGRLKPDLAKRFEEALS